MSSSHSRRLRRGHRVVTPNAATPEQKRILNGFMDGLRLLGIVGSFEWAIDYMRKVVANTQGTSDADVELLDASAKMLEELETVVAKWRPLIRRNQPAPAADPNESPDESNPHGEPN